MATGLLRQDSPPLTGSRCRYLGQGFIYTTGSGAKKNTSHSLWPMSDPYFFFLDKNAPWVRSRTLDRP